MTAAWLRERLPSLMGRSDDFDPRPMMNWSLSMRYFWLSKTKYSGGAAEPPGVPSAPPDGAGDACRMPMAFSPGPGEGMGRPKRAPTGGMGGGGGGASGRDGDPSRWRAGRGVKGARSWAAPPEQAAVGSSRFAVGET